MKDTKIFEAILKKYGLVAQLGVLQEECAELIVASSHVLRGREKIQDNFMEELADVKIMCEQFMHYIVKSGYGNEFSTIYRAKIDKLKERLNKKPPSREGGA